MKFREKLKEERGGTWLSAILITIIVVLIVVVLVSVISLARTSAKTLKDAKQNETEQDALSIFK